MINFSNINSSGVLVNQAYQEIVRYQSLVVATYKWPLIFITIMLVVASFLFAYKKPLARYMTGSRDEFFYHKNLLFVERFILWTLIICTMLSSSLLFIKFEVGVALV